MTVVLDTNLWISMLLGKRVGGLATHLYNPRLSVVSSVEQHEELRNTLEKPKFRNLLSETDRESLIKVYTDVALVVHVPKRVTVCRDPKDDFILSIALAGRADMIITGDKDLLELHPFRGVEIISYSEFEQRVAIL